jgi:agmatine/peptidylarginine deiminase
MILIGSNFNSPGPRPGAIEAQESNSLQGIPILPLPIVYYMKLRLSIIFFLFIQVLGAFSQQGTTPGKNDFIPFSPSHRPRMAAEWEPAVGVLIAWPLSIPYKLVIALSEDTKLYTLIADTKSKQEAIKWFSKWGIMPDRVKFITAPQGEDISWTRDWGPHAVFTPDGTMKLVDGNYLLSTPMSGLSCGDSLQFVYHDDKGKIIYMKKEDALPGYIGPSIDVDRVSLPFSFTGGNVISDGQRSAFSTCIITNENRYIGITDEQFFEQTRAILGIDHYMLISNFEPLGIQHIDCYMKMLDEERLFVMRPPADHPLYELYEGIVTHELSKLTNAYGRLYQILRLDTDRYHEDELAAYSNSLILNQTIYVPLFGIPQDSIAMKQWADAMPGYIIKGFEFTISK